MTGRARNIGGLPAARAGEPEEDVSPSGPDDRAGRGVRYSAPACQGPVIAKVMPGLWTFANSHRPSGL